MSSDVKLLKKELSGLKNPEKAKLCQRFFKTGKGEYGEGDKFLGITVPVQKVVAKKYPNLFFDDLQFLLNSKIHEYRMVSLFIMITKYKKSQPKADQPLVDDEKDKEKIVKFYLKNAKNINNWDLIDLSAPTILGDWFLEKEKSILYNFAKSDNLWKKRISIMATFGFIRKNKFEDSLKIAEILLFDTHDLIHKAVGWMLREIGNRDLKVEEKFLEKYYKTMPRTCLRYAIEKFPEEKRKMYLKK